MRLPNLIPRAQRALSANRRLAAAAVLTFACTLTLRVWGISTHFWLLRDQIRDWSIALGSFADLPLVGPATHVGGYTIGPAFYWILWAIRVTVGPWFENLPHAGGIGQAILQSGADALLLVALWRRTGSPWIALTTVVVVATASYDLCLAALVWNPTMGSMLAKAATALVLLDWHRGSVARVAVTAAVAWIAVHAYTGAIYVTVAVFTAILADPLFRRDWRTAGRNASIVAAAVALLQVPYLAHQLLNQFNDRAMAAVSGSVGQILSGSARPEFAKSLAGYVAAFRFIEVSPWRLPAVGWVLLASAAVFAVKHRRDHSLLLITLLPQATAVVGYALFLDEVDNYYYLSVMPAAVLTIVLASAAVTPPRLARGVGVALLIGALALVPARVRFADTMHRMPEYGVLVDGARKMSRLGQPMRAVRTDIKLPPTSNPEVLYVALGGRLDPTSPWIGVITSEGQIDYQYVGRREP